MKTCIFSSLAPTASKAFAIHEARWFDYKSESCAECTKSLYFLLCSNWVMHSFTYLKWLPLIMSATRRGISGWAEGGSMAGNLKSSLLWRGNYQCVEKIVDIVNGKLSVCLCILAWPCQPVHLRWGNILTDHIYLLLFIQEESTALK